MAFIATSAGAEPYNPHPVKGATIKKHDFSPYDWNGGAVVSICGEGFAVLGTDTRLATGYSIKSRNIDRQLKLSEKTMIGCGGCHADVVSFYNNLKAESVMYHFKNNKDMSTEAAAQLVSNTLYYKRFFPYYCVPVVCGLDAKGNGYCCNYDVIGSYVRSVDPYTANGESSGLVMPILDNLLGTRGVGLGNKAVNKLTVEEAVEIMKQVFIGVTERNINVGDCVKISSITQSGIHTEEFKLRHD